MTQILVPEKFFSVTVVVPISTSFRGGTLINVSSLFCVSHDILGEAIVTVFHCIRRVIDESQVSPFEVLWNASLCAQLALYGGRELTLNACTLWST